MQVLGLSVGQIERQDGKKSTNYKHHQRPGLQLSFSIIAGFAQIQRDREHGKSQHASLQGDPDGFLTHAFYFFRPICILRMVLIYCMTVSSLVSLECQISLISYCLWF